MVDGLVIALDITKKNIKTIGGYTRDYSHYKLYYRTCTILLQSVTQPQGPPDSVLKLFVS